MKSADQICEEILSLPPLERAGYLDSICSGNASLRQQIESLLEARATEDATVESTPVTSDRSDIETNLDVANQASRIGGSSQPGDRIGRYKLLQLIGEGGFGSVFMAEQTEPVTRRVALKIIKLGMDTKQVVARFEAERQALAMMDHPNIARVLDAGSTEAGRPFFVMELVRGIPLTEYCDKNQLGLSERIRLFSEVCTAVQHAHQKGIIHRDLKPSNILVTLHDTKAVPKVIDFGIAKATSQRLTEKTLFTEFRQFVGTPQYMSPEQAEMSGLDIDTRSDVYSLGAVLYELLSGMTPFDSKELAAAGYAGMSQIICEVEPPSIGQRFSTLGAERTDIARMRGTDADRLQNDLRGELQWIVSKALEKDRTRRYETARDLAADLERFQNSEPILAVPPSHAYRLRKFIRRNRAWVATAATILIALAGGMTFATMAWMRAERELDRSKEMSSFLADLHLSANPNLTEPTESFEKVIAQCEDLFGEDHEAIGSLLFTRASLLTTWGRTIEADQTFDHCLVFQRESLGPKHEAVAATLRGHSEVLHELNRTAEAIKALENAQEIYQLRFGEESRQYAEVSAELAQFLSARGLSEDHPRIEELLQVAISILKEQLGPQHLKTLQTECSYGIWLQELNRLDSTVEVLSEVLPFARRERARLGSLYLAALNSLTIAHIYRNEVEQAKVYYGELIDLMREMGMRGSGLVMHLLRYGNWLLESGDVANALEIFDEALTTARAALPIGDGQRETALKTVLAVLTKEREFAKAEIVFEDEIAAAASSLGEDSEEVQKIRNVYSIWKTETGRLAESQD